MKSNSTINIKIGILILVNLFFIFSCESGPIPENLSDTPYERNALLTKGISIGGFRLNTPWDVSIEEKHIEDIFKAGFKSIRFPVLWLDHAAESEPYSINITDLDYVKQIINWCLQYDLSCVLAFFSPVKLPVNFEAIFLAVWEQIAREFSAYPNLLFYELLNEPPVQLSSWKWNDLIKKTIKIIRKWDQVKTIIVGPPYLYEIAALPLLSLPADENNLIVTIHYYLPHNFTQQGQAKIFGGTFPMGKTWEGSEKELSFMDKQFQKVSWWSKKHMRPIYLGEFGVFNYGSIMAMKSAWLKAVVAHSKKYNMSWAAWGLADGYGLYLIEQQVWLVPDFIDSIK